MHNQRTFDILETATGKYRAHKKSQKHVVRKIEILTMDVEQFNQTVEESNAMDVVQESNILQRVHDANNMGVIPQLNAADNINWHREWREQSAMEQRNSQRCKITEPCEGPSSQSSKGSGAEESKFDSYPVPFVSQRPNLLSGAYYHSRQSGPR
jgi:hypothetical protein